ncbi:hypothetical protein GCM10017083_18730 [Thalassobaculum fulvum]|uniref:Uncharacterized protein n=1 Tax=Thalassobaculum fulvum TaxID=1633335 RepID=A0A918XRT6_9PROT|nr:hypothetical protein [Thalassobaculum fulvum]GHD47855.1 hypothetical protein GCM10017083_18730 [Thalassobaculum fulvum]
MFDFLKIANKKPTRRPVRLPGRSSAPESKGTVKIDRFVFNVRELNKKGFIIDPYDKDLIITGQRFRFEIDARDGEDIYKGRAEGVVTKIASGALAAAFVTKFF